MPPKRGEDAARLEEKESDAIVAQLEKRIRLLAEARNTLKLMNLDEKSSPMQKINLTIAELELLKGEVIIRCGNIVAIIGESSLSALIAAVEAVPVQWRPSDREGEIDARREFKAKALEILQKQHLDN